jgi:hypothetical protein
MSDFPEGIAAPEGAQELVNVCKETWAVIQNEGSAVPGHGKAVDSFEAAMAELAEMEVHVNNEGDFPVFSLGVKEAAYDSSVPVSGAKFIKLPEDAALKKLTALVGLSTYRTFKRCNLLVLHHAKGASTETPSALYTLCGRMGTHHTGGQNFCGVHSQALDEDSSRRRQDLQDHVGRRGLLSQVWDGTRMALASCAYFGTLPRGWGHPRDADEHAIHPERPFERS